MELSVLVRTSISDIFFSSKSVFSWHDISTGMDNRTSRCFLFPALCYPDPKVLTIIFLNYITTVSAIEHELVALREEIDRTGFIAEKTCRTIP